MNRLAKRILVLVAFTMQLGWMICAQAPLTHWEGTGKSISQQLTDHHIPLDTASLVAALRNPDPKVRSLAAMQLGWVDKNMDAIPAIETALSQETDGLTKMNLAQVLASMNDKNGLETLTSMCEDQSEHLGTRLEAARVLFRVGGSGCSDAILKSLKEPDLGDFQGRQIALTLVSHLPEQSKLDAARYIESDELRDKNPIVRAAASQSLVEIGDEQSLKEMQDALSHETDQNARTTIQNSSDALKKKL